MIGQRQISSSDWVAEAIRQCVDDKVDIINMSIGSMQSSPGVFKALKEALGHGIVVVCGACNDGRLRTNSIGYPARYGDVICVGSCSTSGHPSAFTSVGREVDLLAPGETIWSSTVHGDMECHSGTSMACPIVSAICAIVLQYDRENEHSINNVADMKVYLGSMCSSPGSHNENCGYGNISPMRLFDLGKKHFAKLLHKKQY